MDICTSNFFNLLTEEIISIILDYLDDDPYAKKSFSQVCKSFYTIESHHRRTLKPLRSELLPSIFHRYRLISELDFSRCPRVGDETLNSISIAWGSSLRSINLSRSKFFTGRGLLSLFSLCPGVVELDLSNKTDLTDSAAKVIAEAKNLERLWLARCKLITDMGIGCIAVGCRKLKLLCLKWCLRVSDYGVSLVAVKCKELQILDLSYIPITDKCLQSILQLEHLEELILEQCLGIDDEGLSTLKGSFTSLKILNLSKCQNVSHLGLSSLMNGAKSLEKLILSNGIAVTADLAKCLQNFSRLQSVGLDGCLGTCSGVKAIGNWRASLKELNLSKCPAVTDECLSFLVQTHKGLRKLDLTCCGKITFASIESLTTTCSMLSSLKLEACTSVSRDAFLLIGQHFQFLEELDITDNDIDDKGLQSIASCPRLLTLKLGICMKITDYGIAHIGSGCTMLREIDLYRCPEITDVGITAIALGCPALEVLNIAYNTKVTDTSLVALSKCSKLRVLEVRGCCHLSNIGLSAIANCCRQLSVLDIKKCCNINDSGMLQLAHYCHNLKQINLSYCSITDIGLLALAGISCLQNISIFNSTGLTPHGVAAALFACRSLMKVKLNTSFQALLPQHFLRQIEARGCLFHWRNKAFLPPKYYFGNI